MTRRHLRLRTDKTDALGRPIYELPLREKLFGRTRTMPSGCIEWTGSRHVGGYAHVGDIAGERYGHRASYVLHNGPIPPGMHVLHRCDNPPCVNPSHLFLGTNADNIRDRVAKGRSPHVSGERNGKAKLTNQQRAELVAAYRSGTPARVLAERYGVTTRTVHYSARVLDETSMPVRRCPCRTRPTQEVPA